MCDSGKEFFWICFFDIFKIDVYVNMFIFFGYEDDVWNLVKIIYCFNEINIRVIR